MKPQTAPPTHCRQCGKALRRQNKGRGRKRHFCHAGHREDYWRAQRRLNGRTV